MILTLLAVALNDQPLSRPITARFDTNGGTVGRADHCTLALPDPERFISRKQAEVVYTSSGYMIRNIGSANPIAVSGRALGSEEMVLLRHGDEVRVGGYELRAHLSQAPVPDPNEPTQDPAVQQTRRESVGTAAAVSAAAAAAAPMNAGAPAGPGPLAAPPQPSEPASRAAALGAPAAIQPANPAVAAHPGARGKLRASPASGPLGPLTPSAPMAMSTGPAWPPAAPAETAEPAGGEAPVPPPRPVAAVAPKAAAGNPFADLLEGGSGGGSGGGIGLGLGDLMGGSGGLAANAARSDASDPFANLLGGGDLNRQSSGTGASSPTPFAHLLASPPAAPVAPPAYGPAPAAPIARAPAALDPFDGLIPAAGGLDKRSAALGAAATASPASNRLPDDFDPFRALSAGSAHSAPTLGQPLAGLDPFAALMGGAGPASIDQSFGLPSGADGADALARFTQDLPAAPGPGVSELAGFGARAGARSGAGADAGAGAGSVQGWPGMGAGPGPAGTASAASSTDPLVALGLAPGPTAAGALAGSSPGRGQSSYGGPPAQPDNLPMVHGAFRPPPIAAPLAAHPEAAWAPAHTPPVTPVTPATGPTSAAPYSAADPQDLWLAFCQGAGVNLPLPAGGAAERMHTVGRVLRSAVEGTLQLMAVRASTKHEMRAAVTQIQARSNNPLKFAPDATTGVEQLVKPATRGFLEGPAAMEDAMNDLVGHSIGTVQGMRSAIEGMLGRFDPAELEQKLSRGSMLDNLIPANRKARLWELYLQHHRSIREEAQEDFHALFGKAFVAAYEQQVERLKQGRANAASTAGGAGGPGPTGNTP